MTLPAAALGTLLILASSSAQAEDVSAKTENYLFAASEALEDGEPALALSLLKRAREEDPTSCILQEYLCRTWAALGDAAHATEALSAFTGCMVSTDESIRRELVQVIAAIPRTGGTASSEAVSPPTSPPTSPSTRPPPTPSPAVPSTAASPATTAPSSGGSVLRPVGWGLAGVGLLLGAGGGVASWRTWDRGELAVAERDRDTYLALLPWNHAAVIGAAAGGVVGLTGVVLLVVGRADDSTAATPSAMPRVAAVPDPTSPALLATWTF